jgi:hypothetical protein
MLVAASGLVACNSGYGSSTVPTPQPSSTSGPVIIYPGTAGVPLGGSVKLVASVDSLPTATFSWSLSGTNSGSIDTNTGVYTAPTGSIPNPATVTVTAKTGSVSGTATITITAAQPVTVIPSALFVPAGTSVNFAASANGAPATVTSWLVNGSQGGDNTHGHITPSGVYTAPLTPPASGATTITAVTSGGSGTSVATVVFSANSFNGPYAFSYSGTDKNGYLSGVGSFTANGVTGTITSGLEDVVDPKLIVQQDVFGGTFTVLPDGTGTASFNDGTGGVVASKFNFVLSGNATANAGAPSQQLVWLRADASGTGSGTAQQQDASVLSSPMPLPAYVFGFSGVDGKGHLFNAAGEFTSVAGFSLSPGVWDVNDPSFSTSNAPVTDDTTLGGTSTIDTTRPGSGRGALTLRTTNVDFSATSFSYTYYIVDETHLKVVESDGTNFTSGDIYSAPNSSGFFNAGVLNGNFAFATTGSGKNGPFSLSGVLSCNGGGTTSTGTTGSISGGVADQNNGVGSIVLNATVSAETYTVTAANGRITFSLGTTGSSIGTPAFAAYPTANGSIFMVETDTNANSNLFGMGFLQNTTASLQGGYALGFASLPALAGATAFQTAAGQVVVNSDTVSSGALQVATGSAVSGQTITQAVLFAPDSTGRGTATLTTSSANYPIAYYTINAAAGTALFVETDGQRLITGTLTRQF